MHFRSRCALVFATALVAVVALAALTAQGTATPAKGRTIEVLFLGHNSAHHDSARFEPMLAKAIESEGFHFTYTPDPNELNAANLARYDALIIYANHATITPDQEKATSSTRAKASCRFTVLRTVSRTLPPTSRWSVRNS
jgi:uncharacterized protein